MSSIPCCNKDFAKTKKCCKTVPTERACFYVRLPWHTDSSTAQNTSGIKKAKVKPKKNSAHRRAIAGFRTCQLTARSPKNSSSFGTEPRPPLQLGLGSVVWCAPECDYCNHTCPKDPHQRGKRTRVRFNRTKQDRCEYTLIIIHKVS